MAGHFVLLCNRKQQTFSLCSLVVSLRLTSQCVHHPSVWTLFSEAARLTAIMGTGLLLVRRDYCDRSCLVPVIQYSIARLPGYTLASQVPGTSTLKACERLAPSDSKVITTVLLVLAVSCACDLPCHCSQITIFPSLSVPPLQTPVPPHCSLSCHPTSASACSVSTLMPIPQFGKICFSVRTVHLSLLSPSRALGCYSTSGMETMAGVTLLPRVALKQGDHGVGDSKSSGNRRDSGDDRLVRKGSELRIRTMRFLEKGLCQKLSVSLPLLSPLCFMLFL